MWKFQNQVDFNYYFYYKLNEKKTWGWYLLDFESWKIIDYINIVE